MATNENVGSAYLTIIPSAEGFVKALKKELDRAGFNKYGALLGKEFQKGFAQSQAITKIKSSFRKMFRSIADLGRYSLLDTFIASTLAAVSALAPLSGLLLGLPAAAVTAGLAIGALALAVDGLGDSLSAALSGSVEDFEKSLEGMTESAQSVTREIGGSLLGLKDIAQESLFAPMVSAAEGFAETMRGPIQRSISGVAAAIGVAGAGVLAWAQSAEGASTIERSATNTATAIREMSAGLVPLLQGFLDLANVMIADMGPAIADIATRFGEWLSEIASNGKAQEWFNTAVDAAKNLFAVITNIGRTLIAIFNASGSDGGLLATLVDATGAMADWAESAKGQKQLNAIFEFFGTILSEVVKAIAILVSGFAEVAEWFNTLSPETQSMIAQFIAWSIVLSPFIGRISALIKLVSGLWGAVSLLGKGIGKLKGPLGKAITWLGRFLAKVLLVSGRAVAAWTVAAAKIVARFALMATKATVHAAKVAFAWTVTAARAAASFAAKMAIVAGRVVASWALIGAAATKNAAKTVAAWALMAAKAAAGAAKQIAALLLAGAKWIWLGIIALINAARVALAWFIALGPIGWIIAALIAIVAVVVIFWDEIKAAILAAGQWIWGYLEPFWNMIVSLFRTVWTWIKDALNWNELIALVTGFIARFTEIWTGFWNIIKEFLSAVWDLIVGIVTGNTEKARNAISRLAEIPGKFAEWFMGAYNSVKEWLGNALDYIRGIPDSILSALGDLGSLLWNAGKDIIQGLIDGIQDSFGTVQDLLGDLTDSLPDWKGPASVDKRILFESGQFVMGSFKDGLRSEFNSAKQLLSNFTDSIGVTTTANIRATGPADPAASGINVENVNINAADNRYDEDSLSSQLAMRFA